MNHWFLYAVFWVLLRFCHPVFRVIGRENIPAEPGYMICANHFAMSDPFWILLALKPRKLPRVMAKQELMNVPLLGAYLRRIGVFGVKRGEQDVNAIKTAMLALRNHEGLAIFPEGTRIRHGKVSQPKSGAMLLATRTGSAILPVYLQTSRKFWAPMYCVIGKPYVPQPSCPKPSSEELQTMTDRMMQEIYALGGSV